MGITMLKNWLSSKHGQMQPLLSLKKDLIMRSKGPKASGADIKHLSTSDQKLVHQIKELTSDKNRNNVTRTMAYFEFYRSYPEIQWAFLGHMVSRNGGWNMTDLKGELLSRLLLEQERQEFFNFLERGNWLIFHDVYPQFLLYEASLQRRTNLFYLLPYFDVSVFMQTIWNHFWNFQDSYLLAIGLVINEQSYLEHRVIQNPLYQDTVLQTVEFKLQEVLSMNQILFPGYQSKGVGIKKGPHLIGQTLHHFASLHERILLGKRLYALLFNDANVLRSVEQWAGRQVHTGSRKDYWPHLFNNVNESVPGTPYQQRIEDCSFKQGAKRLYSPALVNAWKNVTHEAAEKGDWFRDWKVIHYLINLHEDVDGDIGEAYCRTLETIEFAIIAKETIFPAKP